MARVAAVIVLRFAQVYPAYATHYDQPSSLKFFNRADAPPPYRRGYATGKWCWSGAQDVPLNLLIAFALLRDDPALAEAGKLLKEPPPARRIEDDLFRASARFVARQPEGTGTPALQAIRGLLAVGRLLDDPKIVNEAVVRLDRFAAREFAYDGFSNEGRIAVAPPVARSARRLVRPPAAVAGVAPGTGVGARARRAGSRGRTAGSVVGADSGGRAVIGTSGRSGTTGLLVDVDRAAHRERPRFSAERAWPGSRSARGDDAPRPRTAWP